MRKDEMFYAAGVILWFGAALSEGFNGDGVLVFGLAIAAIVCISAALWLLTRARHPSYRRRRVGQ
jgi:hypothetical protein